MVDVVRRICRGGAVVKLLTYAAIQMMDKGYSLAYSRIGNVDDWQALSHHQRLEYASASAQSLAAELIRQCGDDPDEIVVLGLAAADMEYDPGSEIHVSGESEPNHFGIDPAPGRDWTAILVADARQDPAQLMTVAQLRDRAYNGDRMAAETLHVMVTEKAKAMAAGPSVPSSKNPGPPDVQTG